MSWEVSKIILLELINLQIKMTFLYLNILKQETEIKVQIKLLILSIYI